MIQGTEWAEPPPPAGRPEVEVVRRYQPLAADLRANPGRWAVIRDVTSNTDTHMRKGRYVAFRPAEHFEFTARTVVGRDRKDVYVRYIGPTE